MPACNSALHPPEARAICGGGAMHPAWPLSCDERTAQGASAGTGEFDRESPCATELSLRLAMFADEMLGPYANLESGSPWTCRGWQMDQPHNRRARVHDRRRHQRDPAQHHRRARAGLAEGLTLRCQRRAIRPRRRRQYCDTPIGDSDRANHQQLGDRRHQHEYRQTGGYGKDHNPESPLLRRANPPPSTRPAYSAQTRNRLPTTATTIATLRA